MSIQIAELTQVKDYIKKEINRLKERITKEVIVDVNISGLKTNQLPQAPADIDNHLFMVADAVTGLAYKAPTTAVKSTTKPCFTNFLDPKKVNVNTVDVVSFLDGEDLDPEPQATRTITVLTNIICQYTGEGVTLEQVTGTPAVDNIIYFSFQGAYYKRVVKGAYNAKWFGCRGDGIADDTPSLQAFVNSPAEGHYIPDGHYMIVNIAGLKVPSNTVLILSKDAIIEMKGTTSTGYSILALVNVNNVTISGGSIIGDRLTHSGSTGEQGHCITCYGGDNIIIENINLSNGWGDGLYLGGTTIATNVRINNIKSFNNRRNNMSITHARDVIVSNSSFNNANGTAPECGIDIEPNAGNTIQDIVFTNVTTNNNNIHGLVIVGIANTFFKNIVINNLHSEGNKDVGLTIGTASTTPIDTVTINGATLINNINRNSGFGLISNLKVTGLNTIGNNTNGYDVYLTNKLTNAIFEKFNLYNTGAGCRGFYFANVAYTNITICNGTIDVPGYPILSHSAATISNLNINNVWVQNSLEDGIQIWGASNSQFKNNTIVNTGKHGLHLVHGSNNIVSGNTIIGVGTVTTNLYNGIWIEGTATNCNIQNNIIRFGSGANGIKYGITASVNTLNNFIANNDLIASGATAEIFNTGTGNIFDNMRADTLAALNAKQTTLVSGTTIKTLDGVSLLGSGNIAQAFLTLAAGSASQVTGILYAKLGIYTFIPGGGTPASPVWMNLIQGGATPTSNFSQIQAGGEFSASAGTYLRFIVTTNPGAQITALQINPSGRIGIGAPPVADLLEVTGNLALMTPGNKLKIATGTNASVGTAALVAGTVTVNTTAVTAASIIILTPQETGIQNGRLRVSARVAGTSFTILSSDVADTVLCGYQIIN